MILFKHFAELKDKPDTARVEAVVKIFRSYPGDLDGPKRQFITSALQYSQLSCLCSRDRWANNCTLDKPDCLAFSSLYEAFGREFEAHSEFYEAEKVYIRGTTHVCYGQMLIKWANKVTEAEKDLLIVRSVLRCVSRLHV